MDRKFRLPRVWSNRELSRFASRFDGSVVNVSAWRDEDKEGRHYRDYFSGAREYYVSNYVSNARGLQGDIENEFFLDLTEPLPSEQRTFDVVFNHTVLEHIFEVDQAFANLCALSKDVVIVVVPFLQEEHADYGDFWRFTPQSLGRLFDKNGFELLYLNYNDDRNASIYVFAIGSKHPERWSELRSAPGNRAASLGDPATPCGAQIISNARPWQRRVLRTLSSLWRPRAGT